MELRQEFDDARYLKLKYDISTRAGFLICYRAKGRGFTCIVDLEYDLSRRPRFAIRSGQQCEIESLQSRLECFDLLAMPQPSATKADIELGRIRFLDLLGCVWKKELESRPVGAHTYVLASFQVQGQVNVQLEWWTASQLKQIIGGQSAQAALYLAEKTVMDMQTTLPGYLERWSRGKPPLLIRSMRTLDQSLDTEQPTGYQKNSDPQFRSEPLASTSYKAGEYANLPFVIKNIAPARKLILASLSATYSSLVLWLCKDEATSEEQRDFLHPLRDFGIWAAWIEEKIQEGCRVVLVGNDVRLLQDRIQNPRIFWILHKDPLELRIWVCVVSRENLILRWGMNYVITVDEAWTPTRRLMTDHDMMTVQEKRHCFVEPPLASYPTAQLGSAGGWYYGPVYDGDWTWSCGQAVVETGVRPLFFKGSGTDIFWRRVTILKDLLDPLAHHQRYIKKPAGLSAHSKRYASLLHWSDPALPHMKECLAQTFYWRVQSNSFESSLTVRRRFGVDELFVGVHVTTEEGSLSERACDDHVYIPLIDKTINWPRGDL